MIENRLISAASQRQIRLHIHPNWKVGSIVEGICRAFRRWLDYWRKSAGAELTWRRRRTLGARRCTGLSTPGSTRFGASPASATATHSAPSPRWHAAVPRFMATWHLVLTQPPRPNRVKGCTEQTRHRRSTLACGSGQSTADCW